MDKKGLGNRIRAARKERGITGEKLSEACNINATYLRQIEAGTKTPSLPMFTEICKQLNVSPSYLLVDTLGKSCSDGADEITRLLKKATPSQAELILNMVQSALTVLEKE